MQNLLKQLLITATIIIYTTIVFAEDSHEEVPNKQQRLTTFLKIWNETLVNDFDYWDKFNKNKGIDLISNQDILDPLYGLDL